MLNSFLYRYEKFIFFILIPIHLIPVCSTHFYPTLDGPAHLYNSNLINQMFFQTKGLAITYFQFNPELVPNLTGHVLLCVFNYFLPAYLAEKLVLISYIILLPCCFRLLVRQVKPESPFAAYLIFPFIYSYFLYEGFFNFCLSLPLYFYTLFYWFKVREKVQFKNGAVLFVLLTLLYFSHLLTFLLALGSVVFFIGWSVVFKKINKDKPKGQENNIFFKQITWFTVAALPAFILALRYLRNHLHRENSIFLPKGKLIALLTQVQPLLTLSYVTWIPWIVLVLIVSVLLKKWRDRKERNFLNDADGWLLLLLIVLLLLFIVPDQTATGAFVSSRIALFVYLIMLVWLATQAIPKPVMYVSVLLFLFISMVMLRFYRREAMELDTIAQQYEQAAAFIPENSVVLPLNYSGHLISYNMLTYIGAEKKMLLLDNYEALTTHFPLKWRTEYLPDPKVGNYLDSNRPGVDIQQLEKQLKRKVDVVLRGSYADSIKDEATLFVNKQLKAGYKLVLKKEFVRVYVRVGTVVKKVNKDHP